MTVAKHPCHGHAVPNRPHAVSVQLETWKDIVGLGLGDAQALAALDNGYPRSILHNSVKAVSGHGPNMMSSELIDLLIAAEAIDSL